MSYLDDYVPPAQRGVVHFSSVPRDMRPPEVCLHFNQFGSIHRHRFVPYPKKERRPGGPLMPLQYREGWIEFTKAEDAKVAASYMNNQPVNCKRTRRCYGQLWTVKYLKGFSWDTLVEEREGERRERRLAEVDARRQERDTNEAYRRLVMQAMQKKRDARKRREANSGTNDVGNSSGDAVEQGPVAPEAESVASTDRPTKREQRKSVAAIPSKRKASAMPLTSSSASAAKAAKKAPAGAPTKEVKAIPKRSKRTIARED